MNLEDQWRIIDEIAQELGIDENTRRVWRQRQVPHRWRLPIMERARKRRLKLDPDAFDQRFAEERA